MKTLEKLAESIGGKVIKLTFKLMGKKFRGYCIIDKDFNEIVIFEPVNYSNGYRWLVINKCSNEGVQYFKRLSEAKGLTIKAGYTGFKCVDRYCFQC